MRALQYTSTGRPPEVVEDGPTLTHGSMSFGAGVVGAKGAVRRVLS